MRVQAAVPDVVWCPANIIEMNMPVTSVGRRSAAIRPRCVIDISTSSRSRSSSLGGGRCRPPFHDPLDQ